MSETNPNAPQPPNKPTPNAPQTPKPGAKVTVVNQRPGAFVLPDKTVLHHGDSATLSEADAKKVLVHRGIVDASKLAPGLGNEIERLKTELAAEKAKNKALTDAAPKT